MQLKAPLYFQSKFKSPDNSSGSNFDADTYKRQGVEVSGRSIEQSVDMEYKPMQSATEKGDTLSLDQVSVMAAKLLDLENQNSQLRIKLDDLESAKRIFLFPN
jgi:hypothetical protein